MGVIIRGVKNAFRNVIRTLSVTLILAMSIGLALVMLLSYKTVTAKIDSVKSSIGNTITVSPAGAQGFEGGGEPLTNDQMATIKSLAHVTDVNATLNDRLQPDTDTNLKSAIDAGTLGARAGRFANRQFSVNGKTGTTPQTFTIPILVNGISETSALTSGSAKITAGTVFDGNSSDNVAVVGSDLATKNNLSVGSTFTAYGTTITVKAIVDNGNKFANSNMYMPLKTVQTLSQQANQVDAATVTVDSITNLDSVASVIKSKIGTDKADVVTNADQAKEAVAPLENIQKISLYSLIGALVAGSIITLLTMMMIVRERRREIGVLKAIGSSNIGVVSQFVVESLVLTLLGAIVGVVLGVLLSDPVLNALVNNSTASAPRGGFTTAGGPGGGFARAVVIGGQIGGNVRGAVRNLHATVGTDIVLYGLLVALAIAVLGSAIPAWLIAQVKPAEVMRGE